MPGFEAKNLVGRYIAAPLAGVSQVQAISFSRLDALAFCQSAVILIEAKRFTNRDVAALDRRTGTRFWASRHAERLSGLDGSALIEAKDSLTQAQPGT
ncbi:MAG: hypothetical protein AAB425_03965 [Bdellovibrionota bacterium]